MAAVDVVSLPPFTIRSCDSPIKTFYLMHDCWYEGPYSFTCIAMNKETGETNTWTISPAANNKTPGALHRSSTIVALDTRIYMIGGRCREGFCPDGGIYVHLHAEVRYFDTLRPEDGWHETASMNVPRYKPVAFVVDGLIYVLGGSSHYSPQDSCGEVYDEEKDRWFRFPAAGDFRPSYACIQAPYVDSQGARSVLVHEEHEKTLSAYRWDSQKWEVVSRDFRKCRTPGAVLGDIIYALLDRDDDDQGEESPLHGYHLIHKRWFRVELPRLDDGMKICPKIAWVFASGSDRLCLVWHHLDVKGRGKNNRLECMELKLNVTGSGMTMTINITATIEFRTCFWAEIIGYHKSIIAL